MRILEEVTHSTIDYPEPDSFSIVIYFTGCDNNCYGCHNHRLKSHELGKEVTPSELDSLLGELVNKYRTSNIVFSGGDPLYKENRNDVLEFLRLYGHKYNICVYTGTERVINLPNTRYLKIGRYRHNFLNDKVDTYHLASKNQEVYDFGKKQFITKNGVLL